MFLTRWNKSAAPARAAYAQLFDLGNELDRLFEAPFSRLAQASRAFTGFTPAIDVYEDKDNLIVKAELPGLKREEIDVTLEDGKLTLSGERKAGEKQEDTATFREERFHGRFERVIALPKSARGVKPEGVVAKYQDGVLTVTLPKSEEVKPKSIEVKVN